MSAEDRLLQRALEVALAAADAAANEIRPRYRADFQVRHKDDASPVTEVDEAAERAIRAVIAEAFPQHAVYGEEYGGSDLEAEALWLVDPIDGTKSFVRGYPLFSTQIALRWQGRLVLGVSDACVFGERAWASVGQGAWLNGEPLRVSAETGFEKATLSLGNIQTLALGPAWARLGALIPRFHRVRGYGDFLHYHWLAAGRLDAVIESDVNILDIAALSVIVGEAGGQFSDLQGQVPDLQTRSVLAAASPDLHQRLLDELS